PESVGMPGRPASTLSRPASRLEHGRRTSAASIGQCASSRAVQRPSTPDSSAAQSAGKPLANPAGGVPVTLAASECSQTPRVAFPEVNTHPVAAKYSGPLPDTVIVGDMPEAGSPPPIQAPPELRSQAARAPASTAISSAAP